MKSTKFSDVLHLLLHMAGSKEPATSERLSRSINSNAVVVRRIMVGLRERGFVRSEKGHGGGWRLSCDLRQVTLFDVYAAVGAPSVFAIGNRSEAAVCRVEQAVNLATANILHDAEALILEKFRNTTLAGLHDIIERDGRNRAHQ